MGILLIIGMCIGAWMIFKSVRYQIKERGLAGLMRDKLNYSRAKPMARRAE